MQPRESRYVLSKGLCQLYLQSYSFFWDLDHQSYSIREGSGFLGLQQYERWFFLNRHPNAGVCQDFGTMYHQLWFIVKPIQLKLGGYGYGDVECFSLLVVVVE